VLPRPVGVQLLALERADVDVVEERLHDERDLLPSPERDLGRLLRAREAGVHAGAERDLLHLFPEPARLLPPALGERDRHRRVAIHAPFDVERRLAVPGEDEEPHTTKRSCRSPPLVKRSSESGERSSDGSAPTTNSARCSPTAGACWKPWPEKPVA